MTVYKLVRIKKDGNCYPLFIDKTKPFLFGEWMHCEFHPTKGFAERSVDNNNTGGWHCTFQCVAEHLKTELATGEKRVWIECEAKGKTKTYKRPRKMGGSWILVEYLRPIRIVSNEEVENHRRKFYEK